MGKNEKYTTQTIEVVGEAFSNNPNITTQEMSQIARRSFDSPAERGEVIDIHKFLIDIPQEERLQLLNSNLPDNPIEMVDFVLSVSPAIPDDALNKLITARFLDRSDRIEAMKHLRSTRSAEDSEPIKVDPIRLVRKTLRLNPDTTEEEMEQIARAEGASITQVRWHYRQKKYGSLEG